ncbi:MAG TPA: universal stress protein [Mycobacteriales bacterium]|nr:universal stress protein [Mycobacteriales bacterium]
MSEAREQVGRRIVVGVDGSEESQAALRWAAGEAELHGAELEAVYAWEPPLRLPLVSAPANPLIGSAQVDTRVLARRAEETLEAALDQVFGEQRPGYVTPVVLEGPAAAVLLDQSLHADLLAVGSRGHGGFKGLLLGSVTEQCVRHARCSVVVVRPQGSAAAR